MLVVLLRGSDIPPPAIGGVVSIPFIPIILTLRLQSSSSRRWVVVPVVPVVVGTGSSYHISHFDLSSIVVVIVQIVVVCIDIVDDDQAIVQIASINGRIVFAFAPFSIGSSITASFKRVIRGTYASTGCRRRCHDGVLALQY